MGRKSIDLLASTPQRWIEAVLTDFPAFMADHANCERKASAMAMGMIVKYPDREAICAGLIKVAREELEHFEQVYALMCSRDISLVKDQADAYVAALMQCARHGRDQRFMDRLLIASVVECRGAERFGLVAESIDDPELGKFYLQLRNGELKHGHVFVDFALQYFDSADVYTRLHEFMQAEAEIMLSQPARPALH
jgi:tRNA 2-(methylsulfanyl)-N6-isopentenyladenosine37 hydroxylase